MVVFKMECPSFCTVGHGVVGGQGMYMMIKQPGVEEQAN